MSEEFDLEKYEEIAKTIPEIGTGPERDIGSTYGPEGGASVGDFDPSTFDFSNLDKSPDFDWSSFAAQAVSGGLAAVGTISKAAIEAGKQPTSTLPGIQKAETVSSRTNFDGRSTGNAAREESVTSRTNFPQLNLTPSPAEGPKSSNTGLYIGLGVGAAAIALGTAVALSRRSRKRRAY